MMKRKITETRPTLDLKFVKLNMEIDRTSKLELNTEKSTKHAANQIENERKSTKMIFKYLNTKTLPIRSTEYGELNFLFR